MTILLVEDQISIANSLKQGLTECQCHVDVACDGEQGLILAKASIYNVIILDVMMPKMNGIDLCKELRALNILTPILMVSALDAVDDKITGLDAGADDYLSKPFEFEELLARIKALNRRNKSDYFSTSVRVYEDLEIFLDSKVVFRNKIDLELTKKEFRLLEYFVKNEGKILTKQDIAINVWDIDFDTGTNIVEVYVNYLRNKLDKGFEKKFIVTKFGIGYIFNQN